MPLGGGIHPISNAITGSNRSKSAIERTKEIPSGVADDITREGTNPRLILAILVQSSYLHLQFYGNVPTQQLNTF